MTEDDVGPSKPTNRTQNQSNRKKKAPGIEWQYAINIGDRLIDWECKLCHVSKFGGAPQIRDHFLGGQKCRCAHPSAFAVAKHLREEYVKKDSRKHHTWSEAPPRMQEQNGSNQQTPEASLSCMPNINGRSEGRIPSASLTKRQFDMGNMSMHQTSLQ